MQVLFFNLFLFLFSLQRATITTNEQKTANNQQQKIEETHGKKNTQSLERKRGCITKNVVKTSTAK